MPAPPEKEHIVIGVTGSIAVCKTAALVSALIKDGYKITVIMTDSARRLVTEHTFATLSRNPVVTSLWELPEWEPGHIALADSADILVIAPCTANAIGKIACGIADDALSTYAISHQGKILLAPAMNPKMWRNRAVESNCKTLKERGVCFIGPAEGPVVCGDETGQGRMEEPGIIRKRIIQLLNEE